MTRFLAGFLTGLLVAVLTAVFAIFLLLRLAERPPAVRSNSILVLDIEGDIPERPPLSLPLPGFASRTPLAMHEWWQLLRRAETDSRIRAVVLMPGRISTGWAKLQELRHGLSRVASSGKPLIAYLRSPSAREYYLATAARRIYMAPEDVLDLKGLRAEAIYLKGTLDKLGVTVEIENAGKYKDFGDTFTRTSMSPETSEVLNSVLDEVYTHLVETIAESRKKDPAQVRALIDEGPFLARQAHERGLVDGLLYEDQLFEEIARDTGVPKPPRVSPRAFLRNLQAAERPARHRLALVIAQGTITRGSAVDLDSGLASAEFIKILRQVAENNSIRGALIRIDSPGGDAFASDEIWREMNLLSKKKPLVISMSDEAASGGYYIALTGDPIVAYPATYTGSIGVFYGKVNLRGLYDKLGINKQLLTRGRFADIDSDYVPLSQAARQKLREGVLQTYRSFVERVSAARKRSYEEVEPFAQGRLWLGSQARQRGLVDELGGLDKAMEILRQRAGIPKEERVTLLVYPPRRSFVELLLQSGTLARHLQPDWLSRLLARWPASAVGQGAYLQLMPYTIEVR